MLNWFKVSLHNSIDSICIFPFTSVFAEWKSEYLNRFYWPLSYGHCFQVMCKNGTRETGLAAILLPGRLAGICPSTVSFKERFTITVLVSCCTAIKNFSLLNPRKCPVHFIDVLWHFSQDKHIKLTYLHLGDILSYLSIPYLTIFSHILYMF